MRYVSCYNLTHCPGPSVSPNGSHVAVIGWGLVRRHSAIHPCQQTMPMSKFALFRADYPSTVVKHPRAKLVNVTPSKAGGLHMEICSRGRSMYLYFSQSGSQPQRGHEGGHVLILIETVMLQTG